MDANQIWYNETIGRQVVKALENNQFAAFYAESKGTAIARILKEIDAGATIGVGGSMTIDELGLDQTLAERGHTVYNHNRPGLEREESLALRRKELVSDVFLTSANAITMDGEIVNTDGSGNRVAAMIFGPKKAIVIAGINKIVRDAAAAKKRIEAIAAPINAKRLHRNTPCAKIGRCADCASPDRICSVTTVLHKKPLSIEMLVVIVGEELGY